MSKRKLFSHPLYKVLTNATVEYLEAPIVEPGWVLYVTAASLEDSTSAPTTIAFGRYEGGRFEALEEEDSPAAGIRYHVEKTHHFTAGERPVWRVEGGTLNDVLRGFLEGYYEMV